MDSHRDLGTVWKPKVAILKSDLCSMFVTLVENPEDKEIKLSLKLCLQFTFKFVTVFMVWLNIYIYIYIY